MELWLEFDLAPTLTGDDKEAWRIRVATEDLEPPPQPEPLTLLYQLRRFNALYCEGGYGDQYDLMMQELNTCIEAELAHNRRVENNRIAQLEYVSRQVKDGAIGQQLG